MKLTTSITIAAGAATVLLAFGSAGAAPLCVTSLLQTSSVTAVVAQNVERHRTVNDPYYHGTNPDADRFGSSKWWRDMGREDRGGNG